MSEQNSAKSENAMPVFRLQKMYLKDLSFENPHAPGIYVAKPDGEPKVDLNLGVKHKKLENDHFEVSLAITAKFTSNGEKTIFIVEIEHAGVFLLRNIPEEHVAAVLAVECPALLFPFTRQIVSQVTMDGGFQPFLMEPVNFMALFENSKRQQGKQPTQ